MPPEPTKPDRPDWHRLHLWQIQPLRDLLVLAGIIGLVYLGFLTRVVTIPFLLAAALAYLFEPAVRRITTRGYVSRAGTAIAIVVLAAVVVVLPVTLGLTFAAAQGAAAAGNIASDISSVRRSVESPEDPALRDAVAPGAWRKIRDWIVDYEKERQAEAAEAGVDPDQTRDAKLRNLVQSAAGWLQENAAGVGAAIGRQAVGTGATAVGAAVSAVVGLGSIIFMGFLTAFFFFFISTGWGRVLAFWEGIIPDAGKGEVLRLIGRMDRVIAGFVRGRLTICAILAVYMTIAYWLIGTPAPLVLGPVIGLLFIVPFIHVLGVPVAMLLMWLEPSGVAWQQNWWWIVFAPIAVYLGGQFLDDWVLTPTIQGQNTDLATPTILFASIAGGSLAGIYGLLLAIPLAACLKILLVELWLPRVKAWAAGKEADFLPIGRE
jgi:predicted PurR-regulated permease PerM